jgi:ubiquitin carboxyl-terminal hydrolase 7
MLVGGDQYDAGEKFGKQVGCQTLVLFNASKDAKKCVKFGELPPVLQLHLKRFELRQTRFGYQYVKVNDHFKFPTKLHLDEFMETPDPNVRQTYYLHGVLVHAGGVNSGHYFAFMRPGLDKKWYKFDDEIVTEVSREEAISSNFGGMGRYGHEKSKPVISYPP